MLCRKYLGYTYCNSIRSSKSILLKVITVILSALVLANNITVFADENTNPEKEITIEDTLPSEIHKEMPKIDFFSVLSNGDIMQDFPAYINYKKLTTQDIEAIKWSFVLSQLAKPYEEGLEDVLNKDIIKEMKDKDLKISNEPDIVDKNYIYLPVNEYGIEANGFKEVWETIANNLRYNALVDENLNQYNLETFLEDGIVGNTYYISDYVYTDQTNQIPNEELKNSIENLYNIDVEDKTTNIKYFLDNPEKLVTENPMDKLTGQRRLIPVLIGSDTTEFYLQLSTMIYCKSHMDSGMNLENLKITKGNELLYMDSFGNLNYFDSSSNSYKIILPNANNTLLTSYSKNTKQNKVNLFKPEFNETKYDIKRMVENVLSNEEKDNSITEKALRGYNTRGSDSLEIIMPNWTERTNIYNKLLGSTYSINRRMSTEVDGDKKEYDANDKKELSKSYYKAYVGPAIESRNDYRNSVVLAKGMPVLINLENVDKGTIHNSGNSLKEFFQTLFGMNITGSIKVSNSGIEKIIPTKIDHGSFYDDVLRMEEIKLNSVIPNGSSVRMNDGVKGGLSVFLSMMVNNFCYNGIIQVANDALILDGCGMNFKNADASKGNGGIVYNIPDVVIKDIENEELIGDEGGFLNEIRKIYDIETKTKKTKDGKETEEKILIDDLTTNYLLKRDNRLSNRYINIPKDDIVILAYTWFQDYLNDCILTPFFEDGDCTENTKRILGENFDNSVAMCINVIPNQTKEVTFSTLRSPNYNTIYKIQQNWLKENVIENPFTVKQSINPYTIVMGLYRNTDSVVNKDTHIQFQVKQKEVDIALLAEKYEYSIDHSVTVKSNILSGFLQKIHNLISVGGDTDIVLNFTTTKSYKDILSYYIILSVIFLISYMVLRLLIGYVKRDKVTEYIKLFSITIICFISIPLLFQTLQKVNVKLVNYMTTGIEDKTDLITIQQELSPLINQDSKAFQNYTAYREQFSDLSEVFSDKEARTIKGISGNKLIFDKVSLRSIVEKIPIKPNQNIVAEDGKRLWYSNVTDEFVPVHKEYYKNNIEYYFYDYIMWQYLRYYSLDRNAESTQASVVRQYTTEDINVIEKLDKLTHGLKTGTYKMFKDKQYFENENVLGISNLFNNEYLREVSPELFTLIKCNFKSKSEKVGNKVLSTTSNDYLKEITFGERDRYYDSKHLRTKIQTNSKTTTEIDDKLDAVYNSAVNRIDKLLKYKSAEFSDTAQILEISNLVADEFMKEFCNDSTSNNTKTDLDKYLRVIYSNDINDIYNKEPVMYIIQDTLKGGVIVNIILTVYELIFVFISIVSMITAIYLSFVIPFVLGRMCLKNDAYIYKYQCIGVIFQLVLEAIALEIALLPLVIGSEFANKAISNWGFLMITFFMLIMSLISLKIILYATRILASDLFTAGGMIVSGMFENATNKIATTFSDSEDTECNVDNLSVYTDEMESNSESQKVLAENIEMESEYPAELNTDEINITGNLTQEEQEDLVNEQELEEKELEENTEEEE